MPFLGVFEVDLTPIWVNLGNTSGAYVSEPGEEPFIALNNSLKDKQGPAVQIVYQALVAFHESLPEVYRLFPLTQFFEDLPQTAPGANVIPFTRPERRWKYNIPYGQGYKVKGR